VGQEKAFIGFLLKSDGDNACQRLLDGVAIVEQRIDQKQSFSTLMAHILLLLTQGKKYHASKQQQDVES